MSLLYTHIVQSSPPTKPSISEFASYFTVWVTSYIFHLCYDYNCDLWATDMFFFILLMHDEHIIYIVFLFVNFNCMDFWIYIYIYIHTYYYLKTWFLSTEQASDYLTIFLVSIFEKKNYILKYAIFIICMTIISY